MSPWTVGRLPDKQKRVEVFVAQRKANQVLHLESALTTEIFILKGRVTKPLKRKHQLRLNFCVEADLAKVLPDLRGLGIRGASQSGEA